MEILYFYCANECSIGTTIVIGVTLYFDIFPLTYELTNDNGLIISIHKNYKTNNM